MSNGVGSARSGPAAGPGIALDDGYWRTRCGSRLRGVHGGGGAQEAITSIAVSGWQSSHADEVESRSLCGRLEALLV